MRPPLLLAVALQLLGCARAEDSAPFALPEEALLKLLISQAETEFELHPKVRVKRQGDQAAVQPLDTLIDFILAGPVPQIISKGKSALPIPDFSFHINTSLGKKFKLVGDITAVGGSVQDIKSLFRQGPAVLRRAPSGLLLLDAAAGLRMLKISYANYSASVNGLRAHGQVEVEVSPAAAAAQVALVPPCAAQLRQLRVTQLGAVHVRVTGLPAELSGLPKLLEGLFQNAAARQEATAFVLAHVSQLIAQELKRISCK